MQVPLNVFPFYLLIFLFTAIYYTKIYVRSRGAKNFNERNIWYRANIDSIQKTINVAVVLAFVLMVLIVLKNLDTLFSVSTAQVLLIIAFPTIAAWYTSSPKFLPFKKIRQFGWIKPFIIGLTWAGWVTVYPIIMLQIQRAHSIMYGTLPPVLLLLQNFLFFSINAIIFDVKDFRTDFKHNLKTYPVILGVRKTFRYIIVPAIIVNIVIVVMFQIQQHYSAVQTAIQFIPYILLICVVAFYKPHRKLLYYLVVVDGLVFVKAVCGISSILFFKK